MPASTKWRLLNLANAGGQTGLAEIEMATTFGGANECVGGTATSSSTYGGGYAPANAFDGSMADYPCWFGPAGTYSWIAYEFASAKDIVEFRIHASNQDYAGCPRIMAFQYFDGTNWLTAWFGFYKDWAANPLKTFSKPTIGGAARYWAIQNSAGAGDTVGGGYKDTDIKEMEYHTTTGGSNVSNDPTKATAHPINTSYPPGNAFDGTGAIYYSGDNGKESILCYDFTTAHDFAEITLLRDTASGNGNRAPGVGQILRSTDGVSFEFVQSYLLTMTDYVSDLATIALSGGGGGGSPARRRQAIIVC